jgi:hypothetical protein
MKSEVLLITATLNSGMTPFTRLDNTRERTERYMEGLLAWLADPHFTRIVLARNCTTPIDAAVLDELGREYRKEIELLDCPGSALTQDRGKGFGEGEIIRHALARSRLLGASDSFYKITGKFYCPDLERCFSAEGGNQFFLTPEVHRQKWPRRALSKLYRSEQLGRVLSWMRRKAGIPARFVSGGCVRRVDTRMYRVEKKFYERHLQWAHRKVQDYCGHYLEDVFYDQLRRLPVPLITRDLPLVGTSGSLATRQGNFPAEISEKARAVADRLLSAEP